MLRYCSGSRQHECVERSRVQIKVRMAPRSANEFWPSDLVNSGCWPFSWRQPYCCGSTELGFRTGSGQAWPWLKPEPTLKQGLLRQRTCAVFFFNCCPQQEPYSDDGVQQWCTSSTARPSNGDHWILLRWGTTGKPRASVAFPDRTDCGDWQRRWGGLSSPMNKPNRDCCLFSIFPTKLC